jgi:hypothetical protein
MPRGTCPNGTRFYSERIECAIRQAFLRLAEGRKPLGERPAGGFGLAWAMFLDLLLHIIVCTLEAALPDNGFECYPGQNLPLRSSRKGYLLTHDGQGGQARAL